MRLAQLAAVAALVVAVAVLAGVGRPGAAHGSNAPSGRVITVTGTGNASAVPNEASFSFGVQTDGATAREAQAANAERMSRVIEALRGLGIAKGDLQTTDVYLLGLCQLNAGTFVTLDTRISTAAIITARHDLLRSL